MPGQILLTPLKWFQEISHYPAINVEGRNLKVSCKPTDWARPQEERYRNLQNVGDLLQPARSDAVSALLLFLYLLEGEAER